MSQDWNSLPDEEFRRIFRTWVDENCPPELRFIRKQRPLYEEVKDWYQALSRKGWLAPVWPREYGGMGLSAAKHMIYVEEWGRLGCPRIPDHGIGLTDRFSSITARRSRRQSICRKSSPASISGARAIPSRMRAPISPASGRAP